MKRLVIGAVGIAAAVVALRRFGPAVGERATRKCAEMFEHMPAEFPPKRIMRGIEEIREQNAQILSRLEQVERQPRAVTDT